MTKKLREHIQDQLLMLYSKMEENTHYLIGKKAYHRNVFRDYAHAVIMEKHYEDISWPQVMKLANELWKQVEPRQHI